MNKISAAIITLNEEANIKRCLESIAWVDEIVIVDSGSNDRTLELAGQYTEKIYHQNWLGYAEQRNVSLTKVTGDWIFIIDADEEVTPDLRDTIRHMLQSETANVAYTITRKNFFMGRILSSYIEKKLRLFKNGIVRFQGAVHEAAIYNGLTGHLSGGAMIHHQYTNLETILNKMNAYSTLAAQERYNANKSYGSSSLLLRPIFDFLKFYILKGGFRDGVPGFVSAVLRAVYTFSRFAKLYEMNKSRKARRNHEIT